MMALISEADRYYRPGRILALLERWHSHLMCGRVPLLKPQKVMGQVVWVEVTAAEVPRTTRGENRNDGLEASRVMADLRSAMSPKPNQRPGPWQPLTKSEHIYIAWRYIAVASEREACGMAGIAHDQGRRTCAEATRKMARNLGVGKR